MLLVKKLILHIEAAGKGGAGIKASGIKASGIETAAVADELSACLKKITFF
jgi:hypothetical protein